MSDLDGTVKALVTEALFKAIDEKKRDELIKSALGALMEKNTRGYPYSDGNTPLQECFNQAAREVAREVIRERLTKDGDFRKRVESVVTDALDKAWSGDKREALVTQIADGIVYAMTPKRD